MTQPLISCIVPVFNGERYLREAVDSIFQQTYQPLEVLVADDGSTDGTATLLASYGDQIHYLWQPNAGPAAARNSGMQAAQGEFIAFLDADDLWHPEKLSRQMKRLHARPELDLCVTYIQNFWIPELHPEAEQLREHHLTQALPGYVTQTLLAKRALFNRVGQFDPAFHPADDTEWFSRTAEQGAVMELLPDVLVYRRLHETNLTMEPGARGLVPSARTALLQVVKAALDRRRLQNPAGPAPLELPPSSDWRKKTGPST